MKESFIDCWYSGRSLGYDRYIRIMIEGKNTTLHKAVYEALVGEVPSGLILDHLCENTMCCNPDHLEPVTIAENTRRAYENRARRRASYATYSA